MNQLHSWSLSQAPMLPITRFGFNQISVMPHAAVAGSACGAKCNTNIKSFSRKSGDDIPVRIANAIVRIQNPEAVNRAIVQIAQGQPGNRNRYLVLQVRNLLLFCFSKLISYQLHRGDSPLSGCRLPFTPCAVR